MGDGKKIALIARERQAEALRVAVGLILADDSIDVFILDHVLDKYASQIATPLEMVGELNLKLFSNNPENGYTTMTLEEIATKLLEYDIVVPY